MLPVESTGLQAEIDSANEQMIAHVKEFLAQLAVPRGQVAGRIARVNVAIQKTKCEQARTRVQFEQFSKDIKQIAFMNCDNM